MGKSFFKILAASFSLVGGIIGAGFITGGEIAVFFLKDFSFAGIYCGFIFLFVAFTSVSDLCGKFFELLLSIANLVVFACMLSAFDRLISNVFHVTENIKIFKIIFAIFTFFTAGCGIKFLSRVALVTVPFSVIIAVTTCGDALSYFNDVSHFPTSLLPVVYGGANYLLLYPLSRKLFNKLNLFERIASAFISSATTFVCALLIALKIKRCAATGDMPLFNVVGSTALNIPYYVCCFSAVFTAASASSYSAYKLAENNVIVKFLLCILSLALSEAGFAIIIGKLYPALGAIGIMLACFNFSRIFFQSKPRERTLVPQVYKV